jgi:myo-inositol 2-dehydrogenase / D-chiro-inositol 1-dehydrogenase
MNNHKPHRAVSHPSVNRRSFLRSSAGILAAGATAHFWPGARAAAADPATSPNDRPRLALIGAGGQGTADAKSAARFGDFVAIADADLSHAEQVKLTLGGKADVYQDYRKLLERKDIDAVINGTPDHWHTAICVDTCRSGKDIYTEKPLTLTIDEGKIMRRVVRQTGRVVQVGTQQRSDKYFQTAVELVRNGRVGKLKQVWVALPYYSTKGGPFPTTPVPTSLDWDLYQGQAPVHPYCLQRTHSNFRWWYEYAGGIVTDWGNHHMDIALWGMDCDEAGPQSVDARGLLPNPKGQTYYNTPDRFFARMQFAGGVELLYFSSLAERMRFGTVEDHEETSPERIEWLFGQDVPPEIKSYDRDGIMFIGDRGRVFVNRGGVYGKAVEELKENPLPADAWHVRPSADHMQNFIECARTREEPVSPVRVEQRAITACHLTNISLRLGRKLQWDPETEQILDDAEAADWLKRPQREAYTIEA